MTTVPSIFDTNVLVKVVSNLKIAQNFLLNKFFPFIVEEDSELVTIDVDLGKRRMAPFCSPLVEGRLVEQRRYQSNTFKPPYIKDKRAPDLRKPLRRMIGERIGGDMTGAERDMANVMDQMADQIDMLNRRLEWMAAQALRLGSVTVSGDGFPTTTIDYGRDAALTIALSGNALWDSGNAAANPHGNIDAWANLMQKKSGAIPTDIIFSPTSFDLFIADPVIKAAVIYDTHNFNNGGRNNINFGVQNAHGAQYKGHWGSYELWVYNDWYVDDTNTEVRMLPDNCVILTGPQLEGIRAFGQIVDPEFQYRPMAYAPKSWVSKDPAQRFLMMQSSPLVIPSRVNASLCATVCTAVQP